MARRLLMLIPSLNFGGAQRVFHGHSTHFSQRFEVTECVFNRDLGVAFPSAQPIESLDVAGGAWVAEKGLRFAQRVHRLRMMKRRLQPEVCISHLEGADYVNLLSKGAERVVLCVHGTKQHDANIRGPLGALRKRLLIPAVYRRADAIVTVSRAIRHELIHEFGIPAERVTAIPNGFDVESLERQSREPLEPQVAAIFAAHPTIVTSGRLTLQKNQKALVDVFALVVSSMPDARLVFLGDGELREDLERQCRGLGLSFASVDKGESPASAQVLFFGFQSNPFRFLSRASVFALPSEWEGFPMALGEAMACSAAVVSADCPTGPRELLSTGAPLPRDLRAPEVTEFGALMPRLRGARETNEVWAETLVGLLRSAPERERLARGARARIEAFSFAALMKRWDAVVDGRPVVEAE